MKPGIKFKVYPSELKLHVVRAVLGGDISLREAARQYGISSAQLIRIWIKIYQQDGEEALRVDRRKTISSRRKTLSDGQEVIDEDKAALQQEVKRLRAENAYLKKLRALVLQEEQQSKKRKYSQS